MKSLKTPSPEPKSDKPSPDTTSGRTAPRGVEAPPGASVSPQDRPLAGSRWGINEPASRSATRIAPLPRTRAPGRWTRFELDAPGAQNVFLAGSFNHWSPSATPMMRLHDRKWARELWLPIGQYEYLFVVDGQWIPDPSAPDRVPNPFGGYNSVTRVE